MTSQVDLSVTQLYTETMSSPHTHWIGDAESKPAPDPLIRIQALVNTVEMPEGPDRLADPADAQPWLVASGLLAADAELRPADLDLIRGVREGLRAMLVHNAGGPPPTPARSRRCVRSPPTAPLAPISTNTARFCCPLWAIRCLPGSSSCC